MKLIICIWINKNKKCYIKIYLDYLLNIEEDNCVFKLYCLSGIVFSWIGDGCWNFVFWRLFNILFDRSSLEKLIFLFIKIFFVFDFFCMLWVIDVFDMLIEICLWMYYK